MTRNRKGGTEKGGKGRAEKGTLNFGQISVNGTSRKLSVPFVTFVNAFVQGSDKIWIAVWGPNVPSKGVIKNVAATQGQVAATVATLLGLEFESSNDRVAPPLPLK